MTPDWNPSGGAAQEAGWHRACLLGADTDGATVPFTQGARRVSLDAQQNQDMPFMRDSHKPVILAACNARHGFRHPVPLVAQHHRPAVPAGI